MFKKPSKTSTGNSAALAVGGVGGAMVSDGVFNVIPFGTPLVKRVVLIIISIIAAASVKTTGYVGSAVQGLFGGMAINQGMQLGRGLVAGNETTEAAGMGAGFGEGVWNGTSTSNKGMNSAARVQQILRARGERQQLNVATAAPLQAQQVTVGQYM